MENFVQHRGLAVPILRANVDTDAIIPSREMKRVSKRGLSEGLFAAWRYLELESREPNPAFILNRPEYEKASILLSGNNFGCGSSREHAVWALAEYGFRAIIAPGFGAIFAGNCVRNGLLPLVLDYIIVKKIAIWVEQNPVEHKPSIDLLAQTVDADGISHSFEIDSGAKHMLMQGLDGIGLTQERWPEIMAFHKERQSLRPWLYEKA